MFSTYLRNADCFGEGKTITYSRLLQATVLEHLPENVKIN